jgi:hypothetical protein
MSAGIMIPLYAAAPTLCTMVITYTSVIKAEPLSDPSPFHVVWYQTVHGNDRIGVISSGCADGIAMIQDVCDSVTLALSIKGCPELSVMVTDSLSKEFMRLVYLLAPYGIELFRSDLRATLAAVDTVPTLSDDKRKQIREAYKDFTIHSASDPQWEGLTFSKKDNVVSDKYHRVYSNQLSTLNGLLIRAQECQELMIGCYALSNMLKFSTRNQLPAFLLVPIVKLQCPI